MKFCSCITINGVHGVNPSCHYHGDGTPGPPVTDAVLVDGEVQFRPYESPSVDAPGVLMVDLTGKGEWDDNVRLNDPGSKPEPSGEGSNPEGSVGEGA